MSRATMMRSVAILALIVWLGVVPVPAHATGDDGSPQCSPGEKLLPAVGGAKCFKRLRCAQNETESFNFDTNSYQCERTPQQLQLSRRYYAFVPAEGDPLCIAWGSQFDGADQTLEGYPAGIPYEAHVSSRPWWTAWAYRLDIPNHRFAITKLFYDENRKLVAVPVNLVVPVYETPQPSWPCTAKTWKSLLEWPTPPPPPQGYVTVPTITLNPACGNPPGYRPSSCIFH